MQAYLVIREGSKWTDVLRLTPGRTTTVGRATTNQIVIKDDRCSRYHSEIFHDKGHWTVRDLDSRNGTLINDQRFTGDYQLKPRDIITIAHVQLAFFDDLNQVFQESSAGQAGPRVDAAPGTAPTAIPPPLGEPETGEIDLEGGPDEQERPAAITHRANHNRFLKPAGQDDLRGERMGQIAAKLYRLASDMARQADVAQVARVALDGLIEGTHVDAGGILLVAPKMKGDQPASELQLIASRSNRRPNYHRVSKFLAEMVLRDGEGILARNVAEDQALGSPDSHGEIHSTGVICAPIRRDGRTIGLVHLYSTVTERSPDAEDLEFTLAVADNLAVALASLARAQELAENLSQKQSEILQLRSRLGAESELIGSSAAMLDIQQKILQAAPSRATVLIRGESGVGKELVARAIHFNSPRKKGPFVCLNCAALTESLLESELFGHEKGAFTGATDRKIGKFEASHQGTLVLDEIGEMSLAIQAKFLRVLEGHPFERVGGNQPIKVDVRVIAATNRDLERAVQEKQFRADLFFRLRVIEIQVPALRKRADDMLELAAHFVKRFSQETGRKVTGFTPDAIQLLRTYRWPGNVRELKNVIERAVVLSHQELLRPEDLILTSLATASESGEAIVAQSVEEYQPLSLEEVERRHILQTLQSTGWNKSRAAAILGIERTTLDRKIHRYQLSSK
ncbi:MAG: sigma 54-interacting transcriptional regulator [Planctomycetota bacterium]